MRLSGREKATIFLSILGSDTSSAILRYLPKDLSDLILSSINHLPTPTPEALGEVFSDFRGYVALPPGSKEKQKHQDFSDLKKEAELDDGLQGIDRIIAASSRRIAYMLSDERPQLAAFVLSKLPPMKKEEILMNITYGRDQVDALLQNLKPSPMADQLNDRLIFHFAEKL